MRGREKKMCCILERLRDRSVVMQVYPGQLEDVYIYIYKKEEKTRE